MPGPSPLRLSLCIVICCAELVQLYSVELSVHLVQLSLDDSGHLLRHVFQCSCRIPAVLQKPPPVISWLLNGLSIAQHAGHARLLSNDRLLLIANYSQTAQINVTLLQCMAVLHYGLFTLLSPPYYATLPLLKKNLYHADVIVVNAGHPVVLRCPFRSDVVRNFQFIISAPVEIERRSTFNRYRLLKYGLHLLRTVAADSGQYACCLDVGWCARPTLLQVNHASFTQRPIVHPSARIKVTQADQGADVLMECIGNSTTNRWIRLNGPNRGALLADGNMLLNSVTDADQDTYACLTNSTFILHQLRVLHPLRVNIAIQRRQMANRNRIICHSNDSTDALIQLYSNGILQKNGVGSKVGIVGTTWQPALYQCVLTVGQRSTSASLLWWPTTTGRTVRSLFEYDKPPVFLQRPENITAAVGSGVYLITTTRYAANITWYLNGTRVIIDDHKASLMGSGTLQIANTTFDDQGLYMCVISNSLGQDSLKVWLKVESPYEPTYRVDNPFDRSHDVTVLNGPSRLPKLHIRLDAPEVSRLSNTSVLLRWKMPSDDQLPSEPLLYRIQYKRLIGPNVATADWETVEENLQAESRNYVLSDLEPGGAYKFRYAVLFKNLQPVTSRTSKKITLTKTQGVEAPDYAPELMTVVSKWPDAIEMKWEISSEERAPIDGFIVQHRRVYSGSPMVFQNETIFGGDTRSHMLDRLLPATPYEVRLVAFNSGGASATSESMVTSTRTLDGKEAALNFFVDTEPIRVNYRSPKLNISETESLYTTAGIVFGIVAVINVLIVFIYVLWKCHKGRGNRRRRQARSFHDTSIKIFKESSGCRRAASLERYTALKGSPPVGRCMTASLHCLVERQPLVVANRRSAPTSCTL